MPFLTVAAAAGGLLFAPLAAQNALATIAAVGPTRFEAEFEAITPVPWLGRQKTASVSAETASAPSASVATASAPITAQPSASTSQ